MSDTPSNAGASPAHERVRNFIEVMIDADHAAGRWGVNEQGRPRVHTRFPPEPNGYLHIGHAKSICLNYGLAVKYGGRFNLRFDDTNPVKEEQEYVDSIQNDVRWITSAFGAGSYDSGPHAGGLYFASNYFETMYAYAEELIKKGHAYVCDLTGDEVSQRRGSVGVPATSPFRDRSVEENLRLFREMRDGKHPNGAKTLRAKIDLASPNFNLRDPVMYRILHEEHHNTGAKWCLYPMYDWAHGIEDSLENITHSICTLEFEDHRPLYDWFLRAINEGRTADGSGPWGKLIPHPQQIEFAKFRPTYTVMSKRNLLKMVQSGIVRGWDDPRMPTLAALRRRGYTPEAIRHVTEESSATKVEGYVDLGKIENAVRDHLNKVAPRAMAVLDPVKVVIENWPAGKVDELDFVINPEDASAGTRKIAFTREIYIEREDFAENPPKGFFRLSPGVEVRLRWAYFITCTGVVKDAAGNITEIRATFDPETRGGNSPTGPDGKPTKKPKATLHWISAERCADAEVRLFDRLFSAEEPGARTGNWMDDLNPDSLKVVRAKIDGHLLSSARVGEKFQFERLGYFCVDPDSKPGAPVFNRTVTLKDAFAAESKPKASVRMYTLIDAARELKVKAERMGEVLSRSGLAEASRAELTLDEVRGLKEWLKKNPLPKV
ncbi:MAG: glutamine--tRNA ligase/YqeY domain fusion protein [Planctomycetota bacterium]|nr:glutamine--tRNA ligase/YqeY domain fusion protein [Planctomycetota bacterium]